MSLVAISLLALPAPALARARDRIAPKTVANASSAWSKISALKLTATDKRGSGVKRTYYRIGSGSTRTYKKPFALPEGTTLVRFWSVDKAGNKEKVHSLKVRLDRAAPLSSIGPLPSSWVTSATVTLAASDKRSGVAATYYRVRGGALTRYTRPFTVTTDGIDAVSYFSVDAAGNAEAPRTATVRIDTGPPTTAIVGAPTTPIVPGPLTLKLAPADPGAGVTQTYYSVNDGEPRLWAADQTGIVVSSVGRTTIAFWSVDALGQVESPEVRTFDIAYQDLVSPTSKNPDCVSCHSAPLGPVTTRLDFRVGLVDRSEACPKCHLYGLVGAHPVHNPGSNCGATCHIGIGASLLPATPSVPTTYGAFATTSSAELSSDELHAIHSAARWSTVTNRPNSACQSCHEAAACTACHDADDFPIDSSHANHSATGNAQYAKRGSVTRRVGYGVPAGDMSAKTAVTEVEHCSVPECHNTAGLRLTDPLHYEEYPHAADLTWSFASNLDATTAGTWRSSRSMDYTTGQMIHSSAAGATFSLKVSGIKATWVSETGPGHGIADVFVDGAKVASVDTFAPTRRVQQTVWTSGALTPGDHVLAVHVTGTRSAASTSAEIVIDQFNAWTKVPGKIAPLCTDCHPDRAAVHGYDGAMHAADVGSSVESTSGLTCGACHSTDLYAEHTRTSSSSAGARCGNCHPDPRKTFANWNHTCSQVGCHTIATSEAPHAQYAGAHKLPVPAPTCIAAGCHSGSDLASLHSSATTTTAEGTRTGCLICHSATKVPTSGQCATCHDLNDPHGGGDVARHTAQLGALDSVPYHGGDAPIDPIDCVACHASDNLITIHGNDCSVCHGGPRDSFTTWNKGCQQGDCHPSIHTRAAGAHSDDSSYCEDCHDDNDWSVPCFDCHTWGPDTTPPVTSHDPTGPLFVGPTPVSLTAWDDSGSLGVKATYYRIDGGPVTAGTQALLSAPATGSANHLLEYWSVDWSRNVEATHVVSLTVSADLTPPVTTSDAKASYVGPAAVHFSVTDNATVPGGCTTYFKVDGGAASTGTVATVAQPASGTASHTLQFWSIDRSGVPESAKTATFTVTADTVAPTVTTDITHYFNPATMVNFYVTDPAPSSGIANVTYKAAGNVATNFWGVGGTNNLQWRGYTGYVPSQGSQPVEYWAVDNAGNHGSHVTTSVVFDWSAPASSSDATANYYGTATIHIAATDAYSPISWIRYQLDGGATTTSATVTIAPPASGYASHYIYFWASDAAGNAEGTFSHYASFRVYAGSSYTLTYSAGANGTISGSSPQSVPSRGSGTAVTAVPNGGYHFVNWSDGSTANPRTDTNVLANKSVTANFAINRYTLNYAAGPNGSLSGVTSQTVDSGGSGTAVTAVANGGYHFLNWSDGSTANPRTDTNVLSSKSLTANFSANAGPTITATAGAGGTISPAGAVSVSTGTTQTFTIAPSVGYNIAQVTVDGVAKGAVASYTFGNVTSDHTISASFSAITYQIYSYAYTGGTVSPLGTTMVNHGSSPTYTMTPNGGNRLAYLQVDGVLKLPSNPYAFTNVTGPHDLYASWASSSTRTLIYPENWPGGYTSAQVQIVDLGGSGTPVTAYPYYGYHFMNWSDGSTANPRTDTNILADQIITPYFDPNYYTLSFAAGAHGTISGPATQTLPYATTASTVTAVPDAGYRFIAWSDGNTSATRADQVTGDVNATAQFAPAGSLRLVYLAAGPGGLLGSTIQAVAAGGSGSEVIADWDPNYNQFDGWSDGNTNAARTDSNVSADATFTASFSQWYFGSCPFLYTYDGTGYKFEADLFTTGKLASVRANGTYQKPNPNDYYVLTSRPAEKDGKLEAKLVEERWETDYLDQFKLYAVDVPSGLDIAAEKIPQGGSYKPLDQVVHVVSSSLSTLTATHVQDGADVSAQVAKSDGACAVLSPDQEHPSYQTIELDLGDLSDAPAIKLVVEGATRFPKTDAGKVLGNAGVRQKVEVIGADGNWTALPGEWPKPAEFARPYVLDLTGKFPTSDHRVRLTFLLKTLVDSVRLDTTADVPLQVTEVPLASADLGHHGLDGLTPFGDLLKFSYGSPSLFDGYLPGFYTRFGDVTPLLGSTDDKFVVFGGGDELTLRFDKPQAPAPDTTRHYVVYANGYYKDLNTDVAHTVDPLPFSAMSNFPYPAGQQYPADTDHEQYLTDWNTRHEGVQ